MRYINPCTLLFYFVLTVIKFFYYSAKLSPHMLTGSTAPLGWGTVDGCPKSTRVVLEWAMWLNKRSRLAVIVEVTGSWLVLYLTSSLVT